MSERWTNTANDKGELSEMLIQSLIETAVKQLRFSYTPYSHFKVGAPLLAADGTIYTGCNIENAAYTPTNCAERTAFFKAVSEGVRDFRAICIVGGMNGVLSGYTAPCGVCRQVSGRRSAHRLSPSGEAANAPAIGRSSRTWIRIFSAACGAAFASFQRALFPRKLTS